MSEFYPSLGLSHTPLYIYKKKNYLIHLSTAIWTVSKIYPLQKCVIINIGMHISPFYDAIDSSGTYQEEAKAILVRIPKSNFYFSCRYKES